MSTEAAAPVTMSTEAAAPVTISAIIVVTATTCPGEDGATSPQLSVAAVPIGRSFAGMVRSVLLVARGPIVSIRPPSTLIQQLRRHIRTPYAKVVCKAASEQPVLTDHRVVAGKLVADLLTRRKLIDGVACQCLDRPVKPPT